MDRNELQTRVDHLLIGRNAYDMFGLARLVKEKLGDWFDNSQGYFSTYVNAYTITIAYKGRGVVSLEIKRRKDSDYRWAVKEVIIDKDFNNTDEEIAKIHERLAKENGEDWRFYGTPLLKMVFVYETIKKTYPKMTAGQIKQVLQDLNNAFWNVEEEASK